MAVDTRSKRFSLMELDHPWSMNIPEPSGDFDQGDKQQLLHGYSGILWQEAVIIIGPISISISLSKPKISMNLRKPNISMELKT